MGRPRLRSIKECLQCGSEFEVRPSDIRKGGGKFCSIRCSTTYRNLHDNPSWRSEVRTKISLNHADVSGENNPMYGRRGENAPSYIDGRNSFTGETYRRMLLARTSELKCSLCGSVEHLEAHHIDGNHHNNKIENLAWLCSNCHRNVAHDYIRDAKGRYSSIKTNVIKLKG